MPQSHLLLQAIVGHIFQQTVLLLMFFSPPDARFVLCFHLRRRRTGGPYVTQHDQCLYPSWVSSIWRSVSCNFHDKSDDKLMDSLPAPHMAQLSPPPVFYIKHLTQLPGQGRADKVIFNCLQILKRNILFLVKHWESSVFSPR